MVTDLELHFSASLAYDRTTGARQFGYGDTELGFKYRFLDDVDNSWGLQVGTQPLVEIPTGNRPRGNGSGHTRFFLPVYVEKEVERWTIYGGAGYWINPGAGNKNYWYTGLVAEREMSKSVTLGAELFHQTAARIDRPDTTGFNLGLIYDLDRVNHLLVSAGRALQHPTTTNEYSYYLAYQLTF